MYSDHRLVLPKWLFPISLLVFIILFSHQRLYVPDALREGNNTHRYPTHDKTRNIHDTFETKKSYFTTTPVSTNLLDDLLDNTGWRDLEQQAFERAWQSVGTLKHSSREQNEVLAHMMVALDAHDVLELGVKHGKASTILALVMKARGATPKTHHITAIDCEVALELKPKCTETYERNNVTDYVHFKYSNVADGGYLRNLMEMTWSMKRPLHDFIFLDGAHTFQVDALAVVLAAKLLRPCAWIVIDDLYWKHMEFATIVDVILDESTEFDFVSRRSGWAFARKSCVGH